MQVPEMVSDKVSEQNWELTFHDYEKDFGGRQVFSILSDRHGNLWMSSLNGLKLIYRESLPDIHLFLRQTKNKPILALQHFYADGNNAFSIPNNNIYYLYEDDQQLIWICTPKGLSQFNWRSRQFEFIETKQTGDKRISVVVDEDIFCVISEENKGIVYNTKDSTTQNFGLPESSVLQNSPLISISANKDSTYFILTKDGIAVYDIEKDTCLHEFVFKNYKIVPPKNANFIFYENKICMGDEDGLYVFDTQLKQLKLYIHQPKNKYSLMNNAISYFEVDIYGNLWIGTWNGISVIDKEQFTQPSLPDEFRFRNYETTESENFISNKVATLTNSPDRMYIGTFDGMMSFEYESEQFIDRTNDEYKFFIHNINNLSESEIWMSTQEGIASYNLDKQTYKIYSKEYGIDDDIFLRDGKTYTDNEGRIYFTGKNGIVRITPNKLTKNDKPPKLFVTNARIFNTKGKQNIDLINTDKIELQHGDYLLALSFSVLNYDSPEKNKYAYRLEGFDENWTYTQSTEPVVYTNLDAGNYTFRVKAANNDGVWNEDGISLDITKKPAFWETKLFRAALILLTALLIFLGVRSYNRQLVKRYKEIASYNRKLNTEIRERKKVEKTLQIKNKALISTNKDLEQFAYICSHDLKEPIRGVHSFINLVERKIKTEPLKKETTPYFEHIYNYLKTLQNIITSLGIFTHVNANENFTPEPVQINDIFKKVESNLMELVREKNAVLHFANSTGDETIYSSEYALILVLQNLVQNGIKYNTSAIPKIFVNLTLQEDNLCFSVSDNGIGVEEEYLDYIFKPFKTLVNKNKNNSSGLGLAICARIIAQLKGKIWVESTFGKGSTFYVTLKKHRKINEEAPQKEQYSG